MVMATRRVKRVKRSKKQVHRARDRKTNRRHKTNHRRYTRRQRGGAIIKVCEKTHTGFFKNESNASGIDITYDDQTNMFKIGTQPTISELETFNGKKRYERAVRVLRHMNADSTQLNWYEFAQFANMYCYNNADDAQCAQITGFVDLYRSSTIVDQNASVVGRIIQTSIERGEKQANNATSTSFKKSLGTSGASGAAASGSTERVSPNDQIRLERMIGVQNQMKLHFGGVERILLLNQPLEIQIPPNPKSKQNPITKLIFVATEVNKPSEGMVPEVTFEIVLKKDDMSRCAMRQYEQECQMHGRHDEFNEEKLSIKNNIMLSGFFGKNIISIGNDIIPLMDKLEKFANVCESESLEGKMGSMSVGSSATRQ